METKARNILSSHEHAAPSADRGMSPISDIEGSHSVDVDKRPFSRALYAKRLMYEYSKRQVPTPAVSPTYSEHAPTTIDGEKTTAPKIGIIGAGMAGLYAALILDSLDLTNYEILEANPKRVGGRVFTRYFDEVSQDKKNIGCLASAQKWNYIDYGAMRLPCTKIMDRIIGPQPWSLINYLNSHTEGEHLQIKLLDYYLSVDNNIKYYNSIRKTNAEVESQPVDPLHFGKSNGGGVPDQYVQASHQTWLNPAFDKFKELFKKDFNTGFKALMEYDAFSVRAYLRTCLTPGYPQELIDYLETLDSATGLYDEAFTEAVLDSFEFDAPTSDDVGEIGTKTGGSSSSGLRFEGGCGSKDGVKWKCVEGGMSRFPDAMRSVITSKPKMGKRVIKIAPSSKQLSTSRSIDLFVSGEAKAHTYDHVINTVPPAVLRSMDTAECNFSYDKRTALRVLGVDSSMKVGLLFKSRWWQDEKVMKGKPIKGGQSSTDLPIRTIVYPSYGIDDVDAPGVLIASYPWARDSARLSALPGCEVRELALSNIAAVHDVTSDFLHEQFVDQYYIQDWNRYVYSQGAFALFGPGQFTTLYPGLVATEMGGHYHTAGEMASPLHAWIVGALNSAWRCVYEILITSSLHHKIPILRQKWGTIDEVPIPPDPTSISNSLNHRYN